MTCHAALRRPLPEYLVSFRGAWGAGFSILVRAEDSGSATLLGLARLSRALDWQHAEWTWAGTERVDEATGC